MSTQSLPLNLCQCVKSFRKSNKRDSKRIFKRPFMQRWQCPIHNSTLCLINNVTHIVLCLILIISVCFLQVSFVEKSQSKTFISNSYLVRGTLVNWALLIMVQLKMKIDKVQLYLSVLFIRNLRIYAEVTRNKLIRFVHFWEDRTMISFSLLLSKRPGTVVNLTSIKGHITELRLQFILYSYSDFKNKIQIANF